MTTTWKSGKDTNNSSSDSDSNRKQSNRVADNGTISGSTLTSSTLTSSLLTTWSRQQKFAMIASFALLGGLLIVTACSKQSPKPALVAVSGSSTASSTSTPPVSPNASVSGVVLTPATPAATAKKVKKHRPANVTYSDPNTGISFLYPRKFALTSGNDAELSSVQDEVPMNFVKPGGVAIATVALPEGSYPATDFKSALFNVNVNRKVAEQECSHFAVVDTNNADGEPVDAEKVKVGSPEVDMETTSTFSASMMKQNETKYYHRYENGACYEYVLSVATGGYGAKDGIQPVNREDVFAKLEKILTTVKVAQVEAQVKTDDQQVAEQSVERPSAASTNGKE